MTQSRRAILGIILLVRREEAREALFPAYAASQALVPNFQSCGSLYFTCCGSGILKCIDCVAGNTATRRDMSGAMSLSVATQAVCATLQGVQVSSSS